MNGEQDFRAFMAEWLPDAQPGSLAHNIAIGAFRAGRASLERELDDYRECRVIAVPKTLHDAQKMRAACDGFVRSFALGDQAQSVKG